MKVCAIIVAYRQEVHYLHRLLERLRQLAVDHVVLVDNNQERPLPLDVASLPHPSVTYKKSLINTGSSGGFKAGILCARATDTDFVWLLDEDNYPQDGALEALTSAWKQKQALPGATPLMLMSFRPQLFRFLNPYLEGKQLQITPCRNSFLGFHYQRLPRIIINRIRRVNGALSGLVRKGEPIAINAGYYGGLFFHQSAISDVLLPDEKMFLYWDDIAFTQQFIATGGEVWMVPASRISDMDYEEIRLKKRQFLHHPVLDLDPDTKAYYYIRNLTWYSHYHLKKNKWPYTANQCIMLCILLLMSLLRARPGRMRLLLRGWRDAAYLHVPEKVTPPAVPATVVTVPPALGQSA